MKRLLNFRINQFLLKDSVILIFFRTLFKVFVFAFVLVAARYLTLEDFGDFQFILGATNIFIQPMVIISLIIAKIGCNYSPETLTNNLRWLFQQKRFHLIAISIFLIVFFSLIDSWLMTLTGIKASGSFILMGLFICANVFYFYYVGFLQVLESFRAIGLLLFLAGTILIIQEFVIIKLDLGILSFYAAQSSALFISVIVMILVINYQLPKESISPSTHNFPFFRFSFLILISMVTFFALLNMDIVLTKILFDRYQAGYYARIELIGKMSFILSSSIAMVIFPRVSKIHSQGKDPILYLIKGTSLYFCLSLLAIIPLLLFSGKIFRFLFGVNFTGDSTILPLIVAAKTFQSYIFILINYEGAVIDRWMAYLLVCLAVIQGFMFLLNHNTLQQIAINIVIPSLLGSVVLLTHILIKRYKSVPAFSQ